MKWIVIQRIEEVNSGKYPVLGEVFQRKEYGLSLHWIAWHFINGYIEPKAMYEAFEDKL